MFNLKRNQIIITVLVFMIAIAAYLNTLDPMDMTQTTDLAQGIDNESEEVDFFAGYEDQVAKVEGTEPTELATSTELPSNETLSLSDANSVESISAIIKKKSEADLQETEVAASKNLENSFFAEQKLSRDQSRAEQVENLTEWVSNDNLDQESKSKAAANLIEIQERIEKENSAEALLKAKGFDEVYVRIDDDTVDVVVNKAELTDTEIAQIEEIVNRKTGYSVGKINITPLNGIAKN